MNNTVLLDDKVYRRFRERVRELSAGQLSVHDVALRIDEDSRGRDALFVDLVLPDPAGDTWPVDEVLELYRLIGDAAVAERVPMPWVITIRQESPEDFDPADIDDSD